MKKQVIIVLSLLVLGNARAQKSEGYLHLNVGTGNQSLSYKFPNGTVKGQSGYMLDIGYTHFINSKWGVGLGLGVQNLSTVSTLNYELSTANQIDIAGDPYEFRTDYKNWKEKQQTILIDIPITGQYKQALNKKITFLASAGVKLAFPFRASYKTTGGEMVTTGYYSQWNVLLYDVPEYGFTSYTGNYTGNLSLKPTGIGIIDVGAFYGISNGILKKLFIYVGGYLNYGFTNSITAGTKPVYQPDGSYNGYFSSDQVSRVVPVSFGVKAGIYWKVKSEKKIMWDKH